MKKSNHLADLFDLRVDGPFSPGVMALSEKLLERYGEATQAILFYGSCLRTGDDSKGIVDLYVLVDDYRKAHKGRRFRALLNSLLPPEVFFLEIPFEDRKVMAKFAVLSLDDFAKGTSMACFHSYFWSRFSQPVGLLFARSDRVRSRVLAGLVRSVVTFINRTLPQMPFSFTARELWSKAFFLTYRSELRSEAADQTVRLFDYAPDHFEEATLAVVDDLSYAISADEDTPPRYRCEISPRQHRRNTLAWKVRHVQGKILSTLRLLKALFTFENGIDYIFWKIERHSGIAVEKPATPPRFPLLFAIGQLWRLYRKGAFR